MGRKRLTDDTAMLTSTEVCAVAGVPMPTLQTWVRVGVVSPTVRAKGHGTARAWNVEDAAAVVQLRRLRQRASMQMILRAVEALRLEGLKNPLAQASLRVFRDRIQRVEGDDLVEVMGGQKATISASVLDELQKAARRRLVPLDVKVKPARKQKAG